MYTCIPVYGYLLVHTCMIVCVLLGYIEQLPDWRKHFATDLTLDRI